MKTLFSIFIFAASITQAAQELSRPIRANLYDDYQNLITSGNNKDQINKLNKMALEEIYNHTYQVSPGRVGFVTWSQAEMILDLVEQNPVASHSMLYKYDPNNAGFCFGRALYIHLELLRRGVQKEAIKKAFAVGPMYSGDTNWQFHVTTTVKGPNNVWLAIDPYVGKVLKLEDWFEYMMKTSKDKKLRFYISEPNKIGPSGWEYNIKEGGLFHDSYRNYFKDMFEYFKRNPLAKQDKFRNE